MNKDIRSGGLYREMEELFTSIRCPGSGRTTDAQEADVSSDGRRIAFTATIVERFEGVPSTCICLADVETGGTRLLTSGPNAARLPKFSPDGTRIAFLSDMDGRGNFQLCLIEVADNAVTTAPFVAGWVEYFHWSPDGKRIVLGVAGHGADISGGQGALTSRQASEAAPAWMPTVETGTEEFRWRGAWLYDVDTGHVRQASRAGTNIWEAAWCGNDALVAVVSPDASEGYWYSATLRRLDLSSGEEASLYTPEVQVGCLAASPSGHFVAAVEGLASDRWIVAGDLLLLEPQHGVVEKIATNGLDVSHVEWRSDRRVLIAGHRGFESVAGIYDVETRTFRETWSSTDVSTGGYHMVVAGMGADGDFALVAESYQRAPELAVVRSGLYRTIVSFDAGYAAQAAAVDSVERVTWQAPDGLDIQGWLLKPKGAGPYPLVMNVHGGPVSVSRPMWLGRARSPTLLMLLKRGYAVFFPNPRGSTGRGQGFVRQILGELGGAETLDHLSGLDALVARGIADPKRLGVMGVSHGGFMSAWIITQDQRFAAAVPSAPVTNQVTQQFISNIPQFVELFLADSYKNDRGKYFSRSPVLQAHKVKTPTLNICGALDRCTPPEEAVQFHNALLQTGVESVLVTYPQEGHGVRQFPAVIDYATRVVSWFERHMPNSSPA